MSATRLQHAALRSPYGFAIIATSSGIAGLVFVLIQLWLTGIFGRLGDVAITLYGITAAYAVAASVLGALRTSRMQKQNLSWFRDARMPTAIEAHRVLRMPIDMSLLAGSIWLPGVILEAGLFATLAPGRDLAVAASLVTMGGLTAGGFTYLITDRMLRPVIPQVTQVVRPSGQFGSSVLARVAITWALATGLPLASLIVVLADTGSTPHDRIRGALYIAAVGLISGSVATGALARAVALPLYGLRQALRRIERGDLDVTVPIRTTSEIGLLEGSVNDMTQSLRERARLRDLFGRHVGANVAQRALEQGMDLTGDMREVTALFVDVVGSTALAHRLEPRDFVDKLNRLLTIVVDATVINGGLVNKFEGDAALCIFGAPIELDDDGTSALRAARRIRDEVFAAGEFDIGVGVARGLVFAGDIGSDTRLEYTVIGDPVNEAARLTEAAKDVAQRILVSQAVIEAATSNERDLWTPHGILRLRGREDETKSWTDNRGSPASQRASRAASSAASETGLSQTNPRQTYAADLPATSGRSTSSGDDPAVPATTTAPPGADERATVSKSESPAASSATDTATCIGPNSEASATASQ